MHIVKTNMILWLILIFINNVYSDQTKIAFDNDALTGTDQWYTHSTYLSYKFNVADKNKQWLLRKNITHKRIALGQYIYTPSDISVSELMEDDRPYAGFSYGEYTEYILDDKRMQSLSLVLGVVGPLSQADEVQTFFHRTFDHTIPQGWDNQLNDEPVANIIYTDYHRLFSRKWTDIVGYYGGSLGNLNTHSSVGTTLKLGWNVPDHYDMDNLEPLPKEQKIPFWDSFSLYGFVSVEGRVVLYNVLLDGNTFSNSHSVDKKYFVGDIVPGIGCRLGKFEIIYSIHFRSKEFKGQKHSAKYGGLSFAYSW